MYGVSPAFRYFEVTSANELTEIIIVVLEKSSYFSRSNVKMASCNISELIDHSQYVCMTLPKYLWCSLNKKCKLPLDFRQKYVHGISNHL